MRALALPLTLTLALALLTACSGDGGDEPEPQEDALTLVAGQVDNLAFDPALVKPLPLPLTVTALEQGRAKATFTPVLVDGAEATIEWSGGTPLTVEGGGKLRLGPVTAEAQPEGLSLALDGAVARLPAGAYRLTGAVAVGSEGLAAPRDAVDFEATKATRVTFGGTAAISLARDPVTVSGPGKLVLVGDVELTSDQRDRRATTFAYGPGEYRVDLVWVGDHLEVDAALDGAVTAPRR